MIFYGDDRDQALIGYGFVVGVGVAVGEPVLAAFNLKLLATV